MYIHVTFILLFLLKYPLHVFTRKASLHAYMYIVHDTYMYVPMEETNTTPKPRASGPPHLRYLSLGAQAAVRLRPPTTPAVYMAARPTSGPGNTGL